MVTGSMELEAGGRRKNRPVSDQKNINETRGREYADMTV